MIFTHETRIISPYIHYPGLPILWFSFQMEDIIKIQSKACPNFENRVQISADGVSESKSGSVSMDIYSSKFRKCRYVYPNRIVRPIKKEYIDNNEQLRRVLYDLNENDTIIDHVVADNPKRSNMKRCLCHSAMYPCEYCVAKGVKFYYKKPKNDSPADNSKKLVKEKISRLEKLTDSESKKTVILLKEILKDLDSGDKKGRNMTVWPSSTANKELRTTESIREIVTLIENQEAADNEEGDYDPLTRDDLKGVIGRSLFLDIENFDMVNDIPPEYMHLGCLGVVKRLTELTFNVGLNRSRNTKRKLSSTKHFNFLMSNTKSPGDFSRRCRNLDFSVYKAEEFRNIILFFFPHVLECIEKNAKERDLWLYLAFMIRACVLPDSEYFNVNVNQITLSCTKYYKLYEKLFGAENCTYSTHVLCSHLNQIRQLGPLTETSAFIFESFYGEIRNSFVPGTPSTLKQIFENVLLKRSLCKHVCEKPIHLSNYDTALQCDSLVYSYENDDVNIYKVLDIIDDGRILCQPQGKYLCSFKETPDLCWSSVGVFKKGPTSTDTVLIEQSSVAGKVLKVGEYLITCPENVLNEK